MNLYKYFPFIIIGVCVFSLSLVYKNYMDTIRITPSSKKNDFLNGLQYAFNSSGLKPNQVQLRTYQNELELNVQHQDGLVKVILSTQKDPFWQVASLQEILNKAKIKHNKIKFIDLSIAHPYATFKNN
jgi:hypothetical protein